MGFSVNLDQISLHSVSQNLFKNLTINIEAGERVGLIGTSGIGKSSLAWLILDMLPSGMKFSGFIKINGVDIYSSKDWINKHRGFSISYIGQYSQSSLSPIKKIKDHIHDAASIAHSNIDNSHTTDLMKKLKIDETLLERFPHELSGGQLQRVNVLMSLIHKPQLLILDEVTSSQDIDTSKIILQVIKDMITLYNTTLLFISHDLDTLEFICNRIIHLDNRQVVFDGPIEEYKRTLESNRISLVSNIENSNVIMSLRDVSFFYRKENILVENLSLDLYSNKIVGFYGESGSGKSSIAKIIAKRLKPTKGRITGGDAKVFYVEQEVLTAFNPAHTMNFAITELERLNGFSRSKADEHLAELSLEHSLLDRYPYQLSGGQLQRFMFLIAILSKPDILILDETFSALDNRNLVSALDVLKTLVLKHQWAVVIVSHNIDLLDMICGSIYQLQNRNLILRK